MKVLSGLDGAFLHLETAQTPMHVASLHLFESVGHGGRLAADLKRQLAKRLLLAPILHRKLAPMPLQFANPVWVDDHVDLDHHVQRVTLPPPGTQAQLEDCAARLHSELLDRSRPLWRLYVIDGLASGQVGLYMKVHHAVLDGQAGVLLAQAMYDLTARPRAAHRRGASAIEPAEHPGMAALAAAALRHDAGQYIKLVRHLPDVMRTIAALVGGSLASAGTGRIGENFALGPRSALNVPITSERGFAALSFPLEALKRIAAAHEAKLNDVVLALCSGTLRRYLGQHGGVPKKPLIAAMPISLRPAGNEEYTTQATMTLVSLETHIADPIRRLRAIRDAAAAAKLLAQRAREILPTDFPSIGLPWVLHALAVLYGRSHLADAVAPIANVVVSNVTGPQEPLYAAGARMHTFWPMSIVEHGLGLNVTVMSYAGAMGFGFTTARSAVPDAHELTQALAAAFDELVAKTSAAAPARARRGITRGARPDGAPAKALRAARAA